MKKFTENKTSLIKVITAPELVTDNIYEKNTTIFLSGCINNCPNWQAKLIDELNDHQNITLLNPRRDNFPIDDPNASIEQITWEFEGMKKSGIIVFWFSKENSNPMSLYQLGMHGNSGDKIIVIGCDPEYSKISDIEIQTKLARPDIKVNMTWESFIDAIRTTCR